MEVTAVEGVEDAEAEEAIERLQSKSCRDHKRRIARKTQRINDARWKERHAEHKNRELQERENSLERAMNNWYHVRFVKNEPILLIEE